MKALLISLTLMTASTVSFGQWQATNASNQSNNVIQDFCEHQNNLYSSSYEGIKKWNVGLEQWDSVPASGIDLSGGGFIEDIVSTGDYLYATKWSPGCASHMVYKSADDGLTFTRDTLGLPKNGACDSVPNTILAFFSLPNGKIVAEFQTNFYTKNPTDAGWVVDNNMARFMAFNSNAWYKISSTKLYKSTDEGLTWTTLQGTGFPPGMQPTVLEINSETGRIYYNAKYGFDNVSLYTDDEGASWDTLHVNNVLGNSWIGISQMVQSLNAKGAEIVFGADQNVNGSHPEIYASYDGGVNFVPDTVGLPSNAGIEYAMDFHYYNDELFLIFNANEIYRKGAGLGISELKQDLIVSLYPNPANDKLYINSDEEIKTVSVYNLQGRLVNHRQWKLSDSFLDMSDIPSGTYLVKIRTNQAEATRRVVKY